MGLIRFQNEWESLHIAGESNAEAAERCDAAVAKLHARLEKQWNDVMTLQMLAAQLPKVNRQIKEVMDTLGKGLLFFLITGRYHVMPYITG